MRLVFIVLVSLSLPAMAHFDFGLYKGIDNLGNSCSINFLKKEYSHGIKNPLNEKVFVDIKVNGKTNRHTLVHPMKFDKQTKTVGFDHDHLQTYFGTSTGAILLKVSIDEKNGPDHFHIFTSNWKNSENNSLDCMQLRKEN